MKFNGHCITLLHVLVYFFVSLPSTNCYLPEGALSFSLSLSLVLFSLVNVCEGGSRINGALKSGKEIGRAHV